MRRELLYEISKPVIAAVGVQNVLRAIVESITKGTGAAGCSLLVLSPDGRNLVHRISYGISDEYLKKGPILIDDAVEKVLKGQAESIPDVAVDPCVQYPEEARREGIASMLSIPMRSRAGIRGLMRVYTGERRDFSKDEIDFLDSIAELSGLVLEKAEERERIAEEADRAREELSRMSDERERFLYFLSMVAHDLKAPLAAVQSYMKVMLRGSTGDLSDKQITWINRSIKRIDGMLELISDLIDISRLETGLIAPELCTVSMRQELGNCAEVARGLLEPRGIDLVVDIDPRLPDIFGSGIRICQLVNNLVANSARYTSSGGRVSIVAGQDEESVMVYVEDDGSGIKPDILPRIFDDFFKGDPDSQESTGLGLSICRRIVHMHNGRIWAESPPPGCGGGTRVTFTVPKGAICDLTYWEKKEGGKQ
ncbi:MAG: GAF domain-containing sensor histidine kinase [Actinomycetota bacterium]|nr:GAF domain-containing sensor histidine kinase [Actinomycetota bacterium]